MSHRRAFEEARVPGGPGLGGVGFLKDAGPTVSAWGRGRFDVVS
jgi:hypothetical protein